MTDSKLNHSDFDAFSSIYLHLRNKEGRLLNDEQVRSLPSADTLDSVLQSEWEQRADSLKKLSRILKKDFKRDSCILDLGCGNGWMSNAMAKLGFNTTGMDINLKELNQAKRVFQRENLDFILASIFDWKPQKEYKAVIISAALQYFHSPKELFDRLFTIMPQLESVFICDTPFYSKKEKEAARKRSLLYYQSQGSEEMSAYYYHFSLEDLGFNPNIRVSTSSALFRVFNPNRTTFPIIEISASK